MGKENTRWWCAAIAASILSLSVTGGALVRTDVLSQPTSASVDVPIDAGELLTQVEPLTQLVEWPTELVPQDDLLGAGDARSQAALITAINHSLRYLDTPTAVAAYENYAVAGITRDRVRSSLLRFRTLLLISQSPEAFYNAIQREFVLYQAIGYDGAGNVHFTGYFEPSFQASRTPTEEYRYPLYGRPPNLDNWEQPHPTRVALEGQDGLRGDQGPLEGLEIVWLRDRLQAFLIHVQGSARLQLSDGTWMSVGYAGRTEYDYTSIGRALVNDGKIPESELTLDRLWAHFQAHPEDLDTYLPRNNRFVFFRETAGGPPTGTFSFPVTAGRSMAMDKTLMPPGAIALITLDWPHRDASGNWQAQTASRYVLNQDTGGAIQGPGRADIFIGTGDMAGEQAGQINTDGRLFYLILRP